MLRDKRMTIDLCNNAYVLMQSLYDKPLTTILAVDWLYGFIS
jgi:hypothetical protein